MAGFCTFLAGFFCLVIWIFAKSYGVLIFFALIVGSVAGTFWTTIGPVGAEVVGLQILPSALSITWIFLVLPCTFAEPIGLQLRSTSGDIYRHAQLFTGFMYIAASICMWFLRAWKIGELEKLARNKEERERGIRNDDAVLGDRQELSRHVSRTVSAKSKAKAIKGMWLWQRV
jgi:predicted MFS family arabinose efflux permease